jgi:hypothetical protein
MKLRRFLMVEAVPAVTSLGESTVATAQRLVDPTTLTLPPKPFCVCQEGGA